MLNIRVRGCNEGIYSVLQNVHVQALHEGLSSRMQVAEHNVALPTSDQVDGVVVESLKYKGHIASHAEGLGADVDLGKANLWDSGAYNGANYHSDTIPADDVYFPLVSEFYKGGVTGGILLVKVCHSAM